MAEPKRVLISGAGFHNKGAEAMLLAVCAFLRRRSRAVELYAHCADDYSAGRLREAAVHPVDLRPRVPRLLRPVQMLGLCAGLGGGATARLLPAEVREPAAVLDISGFAYSDQWGDGVARYAWQLYDAVQGPGTRFFFLPQGWGPFTGFRIRFTMRRLLRRAAMVCPRDRVSHEALAGLGGVAEDRILPAPDIAFHFAGEPPEVGRSILADAGVPVDERPIMAVTPNVRAFERAASASNRDNEYLGFLVEAVEQTLAGSDCSVVLLAHESDLTGRMVDDRVLCRRLRDRLAQSGRVFCLDGRYTAAELKSVIGHADLLLGSRYHSIVAALSHRVPAVAVGWSHKYGELMASVGLERCVVDVRSFDRGAALGLVADAWASRAESASTLRRTVPALEEASLHVLETVARSIADE